MNLERVIHKAKNIEQYATLDDLKEPVRMDRRHVPWSGLPFIKVVKARGHLYWYFVTSRDENGARDIVPLPHFEDSRFETAYRAMLAAKFADHDLARAAEEAIARVDRRRVYFITGDGLPIKIGMSHQPSVRLAEIQIAHWATLEIAAIAPGGADLEREYHARFAPHRLRGEWFARVPEIEAEIDRLRALGPQNEVIVPPRSLLASDAERAQLGLFEAGAAA